MTKSLSEDSSALITGGAGFIGSNLMHSLVDQGVDVTLLDSMSEEYGANRRNLSPISDEIELRVGDVRDKETVSNLVKDVDVVFHLAAQLSRPMSMEEPERDIDINCNGTITVLETVRKYNPTAKVVYTGSQAAFGEPSELPITETTDDNPVDIYGVNKLAGEHYCNVYYRAHGLKTTTVRLTNVYGPRAQLINANYGVINKFLRLALEEEQLTVYEPGTMKRDPIFVDDVVRALILAAESADANGEMFVIGSGNPVTIYELAETIVEVAGKGRVEMVPWPEDWESIRIGDIYTKPTYAYETLDWKPSTELEDGMEQTVTFYENHQDTYLKKSD